MRAETRKSFPHFAPAFAHQVDEESLLVNGDIMP